MQWAGLAVRGGGWARRAACVSAKQSEKQSSISGMGFFSPLSMLHETDSCNAVCCLCGEGAGEAVILRQWVRMVP